MAKPTIENLRNIGDFLQSIRWDLEFPTGIPGNGTSSENLNIRCSSSTIPHANNEKLSVNIRGHQVHTPGTTTYDGSITITTSETTDMAIHKAILEWKKLVWESKTGKTKNKVDLSCQVNLYRLDHQDNRVWKYSLYGCFIVEDDKGELSSDNAVVSPTITLSYDYYEETAL